MPQNPTIEVLCQCGCGEKFFTTKYEATHGRLYKNKSHQTKAFHKRGIFKYDRDQYGPNNPAWKGGQTICTKGYRMVYCPGHPRAEKSGYVMEHRLVAEQKIGRCLEPDEEVHHIDEDKLNNSPENLMVLTASEHAMLHGSIRRGRRVS